MANSGVRIVLMVGAVLLAVAVAYDGFVAENVKRFWANLVDRSTGPLSFRFVFQPVAAAISAVYDGITDARGSRTPYLQALVYEPDSRKARLREGITATTRILLLGMVMDMIYQWRVFGKFYPGEAIAITLLLAFVPYLLLRGPICRLARHWRK